MRNKYQLRKKKEAKKEQIGHGISIIYFDRKWIKGRPFNNYNEKKTTQDPIRWLKGGNTKEINVFRMHACVLFFKFKKRPQNGDTYQGFLSRNNAMIFEFILA